MKHQWANALLIITSLFGLAAGAEAQTRREAIVKVPYEFVVAGSTLPAGTYTINRLSDDRLAGLSIVSRKQRSGVLTLPNQFENHPVNNTKISLESVGGIYFLRSIDTPDGVYSFLLPNSALQMAKSAPTGNMSASGTH